MVKQDFGQISDMATQHMLAPILFDLIAPDDGLVYNELFIFNNELYKAIANISAGDAIVIGDGTGPNDNAVPANTLSEEINSNINELIGSLGANSSIDVEVDDGFHGILYGTATSNTRMFMILIGVHVSSGSYDFAEIYKGLSITISKHATLPRTITIANSSAASIRIYSCPFTKNKGIKILS